MKQKIRILKIITLVLIAAMSCAMLIYQIIQANYKAIVVVVFIAVIMLISFYLIFSYAEQRIDKNSKDENKKDE